MKRGRMWAAVCVLLIGALGLAFWAFDSYSRSVAHELMNAVLRSEAAAVQQGNLLRTFTKLQSAVETSDSLRGVAVFDLKSDPNLKLPLISLGRLPEMTAADAKVQVRHSGIFDRLYLRSIGGDKAIVFYFEFHFLLWTYLAFAFMLVSFVLMIVYLGRQIEAVRTNERAEVFFSVSKQISHDIKSPLGALKIFASVLEKRGTDSDMLKSGVRRIEEVVEDLKIRSDSLAAAYGKKDKIAVDECLREVIEEKRLQFPASKILYAPEGAFKIRGASNQFKRVLSNLLSNAIEASPEGESIEVRLEKSGSRGAIAIQDHGCGISAEDQKKLFSKGFTKGKANGSGLGLYHAQQVLTAMGGTITLESRLGLGTEVRVVAEIAL